MWRWTCIWGRLVVPCVSVKTASVFVVYPLTNVPGIDFCEFTMLSYGDAILVGLAESRKSTAERKENNGRAPSLPT